MHSPLDWLGPASSVATVIALIVTLLYYLYKWPFHLRKPEGLVATLNNDRTQLAWKPVPRATGYSLYRTQKKDEVKKGEVVDVFFCPHNHHADVTVVSGSTYRYHVVAEDQGHQSPQSDVVSVRVPTGSGNGSVVSLDVDSPEAQWPVEDLRRLLTELQGKKNATVLALLDLTASQPETLVPFPRVCESASVTARQGGAGIGALTRLINSLGKTKWPFTYHTGQGGPYYKLSQEMANRWRQAEAEAR